MIIYILGEAHSGKSTASKYLIERLSMVEISLADPMKRALMDWYGFTEEQLWGPSELRNQPDVRLCRGENSVNGHELSEIDPEDYLSPREGLQTLGEAMRQAYPKTWVRILFRDIKKLDQPLYEAGGWWPKYHRVLGVGGSTLRNSKPNFLVPDVRHRNEHLALKKAGAKGFRIVSPTQGSGLEGDLATHRSEVEQRTIPDAELDAVIQNDGTLEELYAKLEDFVSTHC